MSIIEEISAAMQAGKSKLVKQLVPQALEEGVYAQTILEEALLAGMDIVGRKFKANEVFVPEVLVAARAMNAGTELLKPYLAEAGAESKGKVVLGTVKGDLHDIGKNLVRMMFEGKGLEVIDIGVDAEPEAFVKTAIDNDCKIIACAALLTTTMPEMASVVEAAKTAGIRNQVKIMIGGAPVTQTFCDFIGADAYTPDAASAADKAIELLAIFA
ncbi:MAG: 5-methyltetrahydrofolate--homocysteine methyltransferase [Firmicutes bacterium]|nr:5-methyltetrahydrofolate--homocysteine methyltransferase [Bacillota bacterium]